MNCQCFDFPCSWTFYRSHCIDQHGFDPGSNQIPEAAVPNSIPKLAEREVIHRLRVEMADLKNKLDQHLDISKKKAQTYAKEKEVGYK